MCACVRVCVYVCSTGQTAGPVIQRSTQCNPSATGHSDPLPTSPPAKPYFIWSETATLLPHASTPVAFQHLCPSSPNGVAGYPEGLNIQTFVPTAPVLIGLSH
ncbi:hypothetical protein AVEN_85457-1 [Araneus ventricosus]|uniref:Uncharacterized protein n=1 Tax=Araneus ventricosus TaxID=182803 RepID=A0A4Y2GZT1_ARAVE|nr:hypothetical protein AVEN_85457-1 [Araneus ventricosus]